MSISLSNPGGGGGGGGGGLVADAINDGTTTVAPSQNAVFDALALKIANPGGSNDDFLQRKAGVWTSRTRPQVLADLIAAAGTPDGTKFVRDDGTLAVPPSIPPASPSDGSTPAMVLPGFHFSGGVGSQATNANWTYYTMMLVSETVTIAEAATYILTANGTLGSLSLHTADFFMQPTGLVLDCGTIDTSTTGRKSKTFTQQVTRGRYLWRLQFNGAPTLQVPLCNGTLMHSADLLNTGNLRQVHATAGTYSSTAPSPGPPWVSGIGGSNAQYAFVTCRLASAP